MAWRVVARAGRRQQGPSSVRSCRSSRGVLSVSSRAAHSLVIAEHDNSTISPGTYATVTAATQIGGTVDILLLGHNLGAAAKAASTTSGVSNVLTLDDQLFAHRSAEDYAKALTLLLAERTTYTHVLAPTSNHGKNYLPRAAALLDSSPLTDVIKVVDAETFQRPMYAGNAIATVQMSDKIKFLLVRPTVFDKASSASASPAPVQPLGLAAAACSTGLSSWLSESAKKSDRPDLATARVVVSGGRGMKSGENFSLLETLADKLGGAVGASRAAVDAGFVNNEYQVGQTGKVVAPDLYIAVGISGAIQHLSGMKDSKTIVAINKDKEAPIFQVADYGLVQDLFTALPEMNGKL